MKRKILPEEKAEVKRLKEESEDHGTEVEGHEDLILFHDDQVEHELMTVVKGETFLEEEGVAAEQNGRARYGHPIGTPSTPLLHSPVPHVYPAPPGTRWPDTPHPRVTTVHHARYLSSHHNPHHHGSPFITPGYHHTPVHHKRFPNGDVTGGYPHSPYNVAANQRIPGYDVTASQRIPVYEGTHNQSYPAYDVTPNHGIPAYDVTANQRTEAYNPTVNQRIPAYDVTVNQRIPAYDVTASQGIPSPNVVSCQRIPHYDVTTYQGTPAYDVTTNHGPPVYGVMANQGASTAGGMANQVMPRHGVINTQVTPVNHVSPGHDFMVNQSAICMTNQGAPVNDAMAMQRMPVNGSIPNHHMQNYATYPNSPNLPNHQNQMCFVPKDEPATAMPVSHTIPYLQGSVNHSNTGPTNQQIRTDEISDDPEGPSHESTNHNDIHDKPTNENSVKVEPTNQNNVKIEPSNQNNVKVELTNQNIIKVELTNHERLQHESQNNDVTTSESPNHNEPSSEDLPIKRENPFESANPVSPTDDLTSTPPRDETKSPTLTPEKDSVEGQEEDSEADKSDKPFVFSSYLYNYLKSVKNISPLETMTHNDTSAWSSDAYTPPESPSATPAPSPTATTRTPSPTPAPTPPESPLCTLVPLNAHDDLGQDGEVGQVTEYVGDLALLKEFFQEVKEKSDLEGGDLPLNLEFPYFSPSSPTLYHYPSSQGESLSSGDEAVRAFMTGTSEMYIHGTATATSIPLQEGHMPPLTSVSDSLQLPMTAVPHGVVVPVPAMSPSMASEAATLGYVPGTQYACPLCSAVLPSAHAMSLHLGTHPHEPPAPPPQEEEEDEEEKWKGGLVDYTIHIPGFGDALSPAPRKGLTPSRRGRRRREPNTMAPSRGPPKDRQYQCQECGGTFTSRGHLKRHMEAHGADRRHKCDLCSASYSRQDNLLKHVEVHYGSGMYSIYT